MKCPACGFESPDGAEWCDLCKEPFRKKAPKPPPAPPAPAPVRTEADPKGDPVAALSGLAGLGDGERIPVLPGWVRAIAWGFLALWALLALVVFGFYFGKKGLGQ